MEDEITNRAFGFPPPPELARMLSPKTPKRGIEVAGELLRLHDYNCIVDRQPFLAALDDVVAQFRTFTPQPAGSGESVSYPSLAEFLTECVEACHKALDRQHGFPLRQDRWYQRLEFTVARQVGDRVDHASPLGQTLRAEKEYQHLEQLYWRPPLKKPAHRIMLPVEVKSSWRDMVSQAATYARSPFSANPTRTFALVPAFN